MQWASLSALPVEVRRQVLAAARRRQFAKGVVVTSTTVLEATRKWAKSRRNIEVLDGETLMEMNG